MTTDSCRFCSHEPCVCNPYDEVYSQDDADEVVIITMTRRQWWHLDDWRAEHRDRYPRRAAERDAAWKAINDAEVKHEL